MTVESTLDDKAIMLSKLPQFAGMSIKDIMEYLTMVDEKDNSQWLRKYIEEKTIRDERDLSRIKELTEKGDNVYHGEVKIEPCLRLAPNQIENGGFVLVQNIDDAQKGFRLTYKDNKIYLKKIDVIKHLKATPLGFCR